MLEDAAVFKAELAFATRETFAPKRVADIRGKIAFRGSSARVIRSGWRKNETRAIQGALCGSNRKSAEFQGAGPYITGGIRDWNSHGFGPARSPVRDSRSEMW